MTSSHHTEFEKTIRQAAMRWHVWDIFSDFCEMSAIALYNAVFHDQAQEEKYLNIVGKYSKDEVKALTKLLSMTVLALEEGYQDFLGQIFMQLELGNQHRGQFFTPYALCKATAELNIDDRMKQQLDGGKPITVSDPACGSGAMVIGMAEALHQRGFNYQKQMHATLTDVDAVAFHMAYIQMTLLHIPAVVVHGNTLTMETYKQWPTLSHVMGRWDYKLSKPEAQIEECKQLELHFDKAA